MKDDRNKGEALGDSSLARVKNITATLEGFTNTNVNSVLNNYEVKLDVYSLIAT